jgi:hypothetical protein
MEQEEWNTIRADYHERKRIERIEGIKEEKAYLDFICRRLEVDDYRKIKESNELPKEILSFCEFKKTDDDRYIFISNVWGVELAEMNILFKYEEEAKQRMVFYQSIGDDVDDRYQQWLDYKEVEENSDDPETIAQNRGELEYEMIKFLEENYWEMGYDGSWIRKDWDYNKTGSLSLIEAYQFEKAYQDNLEKAKNQKPEDLIIKFKNK